MCQIQYNTYNINGRAYVYGVRWELKQIANKVYTSEILKETEKLQRKKSELDGRNWNSNNVQLNKNAYRSNIVLLGERIAASYIYTYKL